MSREERGGNWWPYVRTYARFRVFSATRIARIYASRPRQVTSDIICSWNNRFYCLAVGVQPIPDADAPLFTRYTRIRVHCATPPVHRIIFPSLCLSPFLPLPPPSHSLSFSYSISLSFYSPTSHVFYSLLSDWTRVRTCLRPAFACR